MSSAREEKRAHDAGATADALKHVQPDVPLDEAGDLSALDSNRDLIGAPASSARGRRGSYDLLSTDF